MINMAQVLGRVGRVETKTTSNGTKITNMSIVTTKKYNKNNEQVEKKTWHSAVLFAKLAEIAENYVNVGDLIYVHGEMDNDKYVDKQGVERTKFIIIVHEIKLLPKNKEQGMKVISQEQTQLADEDCPW